MKLLTISQAAQQTGETVKRLRYWDTVGLVRAQRAGRDRRYGSEELAQIEQAKIYTSRGLRPRDVVQLFKGRSERKRLGTSVDEATKLRERLEAKGTVHLHCPDFASYNSSYKRVRRVLHRMGRKGTMTKDGETLTIVVD